MLRAIKAEFLKVKGSKVPLWTALAVVAYAGMAGGLYASRDWGESWHFVEMGLPPYVNVTQLASLHDTLFVGATPEMLLRSTDGGTRWTTLNFGFSPTGDVTALAANNRTLFAGLYKGVYRSSDGGMTWSKPTGSDTEIHVVVLSAANPVGEVLHKVAEIHPSVGSEIERGL